MYLLPSNITVNGKATSKLEHADDLMVLSMTGHKFPSQANSASTHMGDIGCEIQTMKCLWGAVGIKPSTQEFYLDRKLLEEASKLQYVGMWHDLKAKGMYMEHHHIYLEKTEREWPMLA
jgi:hypothetical protein